MKEIIVTINTDGSTKVEGFGFVGNECDAKMDSIEKALGKVSSMKKKPEYYDTTKINETIKIR